jgi:DNA-binding CsgD family transcriptional regulator/tetratricopeptide (TPR) repeat protein
MDLLERDELLASLRAELRTAGSTGAIAFLEGESGVGKTSVVRALAADLPRAVRLLWGACDALSTPRPLGPLLDMASGGARRVAQALDAGSASHALYAALLADLQTPSLAVIEDAHWADEATLDLLRFVGRRASQTRSLLLVTMRDDEVGPDHPLRSVLGDLATASARRLRVSPLSLEGVRRLAASQPIDAERLHAASGGNPFYVTEVLAAPGWTVPPSVRDAVHARVARLPEATRTPLEAVSIDPGAVQRTVLRALDIADDAVASATEAAVLVDDGDRLSFRHELARLAIADALPAGRRMDLHRRMLDTLVDLGVTDVARLAHHAAGSGQPAAELEWSMAAAREAALAGAHREAAAQYARAVRHADLLPRSEAIDLFERYGELLIIIDQPARAVDIWERVVGMRRATDDRIGVAVAEAMYARALWTAGRGEEAYPLISRTTEALEGEPDPRVCLAFGTRAYLAMLARRSEEAVLWARRAIDLEPSGEYDWVLPMALNALGSARICGFQDIGGIDDLLLSQRRAAEIGSRRYVAAAYTNLGSGLGEIRRYAEAERYLQEGIDYATAEDLDFTKNYCIAWLGRVRFEQGRWPEALELAERALADEEISPISPMVALTVQARVATRRGSPDAARPLKLAWRLAEQSGDLQRLWPAVAARAELAWLTGSPADAIGDDLHRVLQLAREKRLAWAIGELACWQQRLALDNATDVADAAEPFAAQLKGDHVAAAAAWRRLGCPYEEAWALADSGTEAAMRDGLAILIRLGAEPLADRVRRSLRALGATGVPRARRRSTAAAPSGLTVREQEVLALVARGLTDRQIAERLFVSPKTAGHHVSAILAKLGVSRRTEAAATALSMGWIQPENGEPSR